MYNGSIPADGGSLIVDENEYQSFIEQEPLSVKYLKRYVGAEDYINNNVRYCLWLVNCPPEELRTMSHVRARVQLVKAMREASSKAATKQKALTPSIFTENRQPKEGNYLAIPRTSSLNRKYIPIGFLSSEIIAANDLQIVPKATLYDFGILISEMHMTWVKYTCGRLKSDIRYSAKYTYNTYPWPENPTEKQVQAVEAATQNVLDARALFQNHPSGGRGPTLADLYDPNTMPPVLVKAHQALDKAVDLCYRPQPFINETKRIEFLFELYDKYTSGMFVSKKEKAKSKKIKIQNNV